MRVVRALAEPIAKTDCSFTALRRSEHEPAILAVESIKGSAVDRDFMRVWFPAALWTMFARHVSGIASPYSPNAHLKHHSLDPHDCAASFAYSVTMSRISAARRVASKQESNHCLHEVMQHLSIRPCRAGMVISLSISGTVY